MGVWSEGASPVKYDLYDLTVFQNRKGKCFFMKYAPGMMMKAAQTLQGREDSHRRMSFGWNLTIAGLIIASLALVANVVISLIKLCK